MVPDGPAIKSQAAWSHSPHSLLLHGMGPAGHLFASLDHGSVAPTLHISCPGTPLLPSISQPGYTVKCPHSAAIQEFPLQDYHSCCLRKESLEWGSPYLEGLGSTLSPTPAWKDYGLSTGFNMGASQGCHR